MVKFKVLVTLFTMPLITLALSSSRVTDWFLKKNDIPISIIKSENENIGNNLKLSYELSQNAVKSLPAEIAFTAGTAAAGAIPVVGPIVSALAQISQRFLAEGFEADWVQPLLNSMAMYVDEKASKIAADQSLVSAQSKMKTINDDCRLIKSSNNETYKIAKIAIMETNLKEITYKLSASHSIFRQFPLVAVPLLFGMSSFLPVFERLMYSLIPDSAAKSQVTCEFANVLEQYRILTVAARIKWLETLPAVDGYAKKVLALPYNPNGYGVSEKLACINFPGQSCSPSGTLSKYRIVDRFEKSYGACYHVPVKMEDHWYTDNPEISLSDQTHQCMDEFLKVLRERVEKEFEEPISLVRTVCNLKKLKH